MFGSREFNVTQLRFYNNPLPPIRVHRDITQDRAGFISGPCIKIDSGTVVKEMALLRDQKVSLDEFAVFILIMKIYNCSHGSLSRYGIDVSMIAMNAVNAPGGLAQGVSNVLSEYAFSSTGPLLIVMLSVIEYGRNSWIS